MGFVVLDVVHRWLHGFRILKALFQKRMWRLSRTYLTMVYVFLCIKLKCSSEFVMIDQNAVCRFTKWSNRAYIFWTFHRCLSSIISTEMLASMFIQLSMTHFQFKLQTPTSSSEPISAQISSERFWKLSVLMAPHLHTGLHHRNPLYGRCEILIIPIEIQETPVTGLLRRRPDLLAGWGGLVGNSRSLGLIWMIPVGWKRCQQLWSMMSPLKRKTRNIPLNKSKWVGVEVGGCYRWRRVVSSSIMAISCSFTDAH